MKFDFLQSQGYKCIVGGRRQGKSVLAYHIMRKVLLKTYLETYFRCWDRPVEIYYDEFEI